MIFHILQDSMDSCIEHEEHERSLFPLRIVEVESEEQVRPSLRLFRGRFSHEKDRVIIGCVFKNSEYRCLPLGKLITLCL